MKIKTVCINLERSSDRRQHMLGIADKITLPFEFFKACDYNNLELVGGDEMVVSVAEGDDDYIITIKGDTSGGKLKEIHYKGEFTGLYHDPKRYLEDQVEHFGRKHYQEYHGIPYAHPIKCLDFEGDHCKKWINYKGETAFYVDISHFRKYIAKAEIACALSHYKVLEQLIDDEEYDAYLILEDDVVLQESKSDVDDGQQEQPEYAKHEQVEYNLKNVLDELQLYEPLWDIAYLNEPKFIAPNTLVPYNKYWNLGVYSNFTDACSYIVTKKTARELLDLYQGQIDLCADDFLTRQVQLYSLRTKKPIFINNYSQKSTIRTDEIEDEMENLFQKFNDGVIVY